MQKAKMSGRDLTTLILLVLMSVFLFADQRIMAAILNNIADEYKVGIDTLGFIGSAFTVIGAVTSIFFGFYTDRFSRKKLLIAVVLIGEIPCLLTGLQFFTPTLESFIVLRVLTGIGIGGIYPISFSLISDYFREEHRARASAWLGVSWIIGATLGQAIAGYLTNSYGWRIGFLLAAIPNFPLALIFYLYAREPERGRTEAALEELIQQGHVYKQKIELRDFLVILKNKTNIFAFLQGIPGTIPWGILGFYMILYFEQFRGISKEQATTIFLILGSGVLIGSVFWAYIGEILYKKDPKLMPLLCGIGILAGVVPAYFLMNINPASPPSADDVTNYYMLALATGILVSVASSNVKAILMNVNRPEHRGSVFAVFNITDNLGQGFGPAIGGMLITSGASYLYVMNFSIIWWIPCGLLFFLVMTSIKRDRDTLQSLMKERANEMKKR
jgi:MFS family permease